MKFGDVESHPSLGCLIAGVQGSNLGWGCSIRGGSLALIGHGHVIKWPKILCVNETVTMVWHLMHL